MMPDKLLQYAGYGIWNRRDFKNGGKSWKDKSEWKIIENAHPAIITEEQAEAIHAVRTQRTCRPGKRGKVPSPWVLSGGLLVCAHCGANYAGRKKDSRNYYVCGAHIYRDGIDCTKPWYIRSEDVESAAFDCIQMVLASDSKHTKRIVDAYNRWCESQAALYLSTQKSRQAELERLRSEIANLTASLAAGVDPVTIRQAINERARHVEKLEPLGDVEVPAKLSVKDLDRCALEVRKIAESQDPDRKRAILRNYITAMTAHSEKRTVKVTVRPLSTIYGHSLVGQGVVGENSNSD